MIKITQRLSIYDPTLGYDNPVFLYSVGLGFIITFYLKTWNISIFVIMSEENKYDMVEKSKQETSLFNPNFFILCCVTLQLCLYTIGIYYLMVIKYFTGIMIILLGNIQYWLRFLSAKIFCKCHYSLYIDFTHINSF